MLLLLHVPGNDGRLLRLPAGGGARLNVPPYPLLLLLLRGRGRAANVERRLRLNNAGLPTQLLPLLGRWGLAAVKPGLLRRRRLITRGRMRLMHVHGLLVHRGRRAAAKVLLRGCGLRLLQVLLVLLLRRRRGRGRAADVERRLRIFNAGLPTQQRRLPLLLLLLRLRCGGLEP
jgi:hypothetical protein